jgi:hypothetical protein
MFLKMRGISSSPERLSASEGGPCPVGISYWNNSYCLNAIYDYFTSLPGYGFMTVRLCFIVQCETIIIVT